MINNNENLNNIIGRSLKVNVFLDDYTYTNVYPVDSNDNQIIINSLTEFVSNYNIRDWGFELSKPFIVSKNKVCSVDYIMGDLKTNIIPLMEDGSSLKLTK